ncbi:Cytochrome c oxidase subunit III [Polystyrenella longa]|uniref:Cytochrome c oxidase subunit III n=1 Tax=Polystyrenella longa TaxID=2528007 RepID=A0A518CNJ1_9PLAN|nr:cytochrome c oxidase subunit 3 [Polystyrenella longa]QDU80795.1 Cytochrome c oxidase subunit III [Polystyrenella longa]
MATSYRDKNPITTSQHIEAWTLGMKLLIGSLSIFFLAGILGYVVIQQQHISLRYSKAFTIPMSLWWSTAALILVSFAMHRAMVSVRREQFQTKRMILISLAGAVAFTVFQIVGMTEVLQGHYQLLFTSEKGMNGIAFCLMLMHALHVAIGLIWLGVVAKNIFTYRYDHEYHLGLSLCAFYWHFLDFIWIVMFLVFIGTNLA